jgi:hypothetical protein
MAPTDNDAVLFVDLFHGRDHLDQDMQDWGYHGPVLGPFCAVQNTYGVEYKCFTAEGALITLPYAEGCIAYDASFYGEICVFSRQSLVTGVLTPDDHRLHQRLEPLALTLQKAKNAPG